MNLGFEPDVLKSRLMIQFVRGSELYATEDHIVWKSTDNGNTWKQVCRLEPLRNNLFSIMKDSALRSYFIRVFRRNIGIHNLVVLPSGTILIHYDGIYRYDGNGTCARHVFGFEDLKVIGPLKNGFVYDPVTNAVYFGEYNMTRPYGVRIFMGSDDGRQWKEIYRFSEGRIRHVHSLVPDQYRKRIWICTGDGDGECALFYTDDQFRSLQLLGGGDQSWRMVSLIPTEDALFWGSDAGQDAPADAINYIYCWSFSKNNRTRLNEINKPAYYSMRLKNGAMAIGVHHEPKIKRLVTPTADLWISSTTGDDWKHILSLPYKNIGRTYATAYGSIILPIGDQTADSFYFTPLNVEKNDFQLLRLKS